MVTQKIRSFGCVERVDARAAVGTSIIPLPMSRTSDRKLLHPMSRLALLTILAPAIQATKDLETLFSDAEAVALNMASEVERLTSELDRLTDEVASGAKTEAGLAEEWGTKALHFAAKGSGPKGGSSVRAG